MQCTKSHESRQTSGNVDDHECYAQGAVFPAWLMGRHDFQQFVGKSVLHRMNPRFVSNGGAKLVEELARIMRIPGAERTISELRLLSDWLKQKKVFVQLSEEHLLELCRKMWLLECPADTVVVTRGDSSDAFSVVLEGTLVVTIGTSIINHIHAGECASRAVDIILLRQRWFLGLLLQGRHLANRH